MIFLWPVLWSRPRLSSSGSIGGLVDSAFSAAAGRRHQPSPPIPSTTTPGSDVQVQIYLSLAGCVSIATQNAVHVRLQMGLCQVNITRRNEKVRQQQGRKLLKITLAQPPVF